VVIDIEGVIAAIFTLVFVILCPLIIGRRPKDILNYLKDSSTYGFIITCALLATSVIAIWLTIRAGSVLIENLFTENYLYSQYLILDLISYILVVNLCFGLTKTLRQRIPRLSGIASAAIQSVLIGVIVFLPKNNSYDFLYILQVYNQGVIGFLMLSVSIAVILISLTILWNRSEKTTSEELEKLKKDVEELKEKEDRRVSG
jgi:hypothetical protein